MLVRCASIIRAIFLYHIFIKATVSQLTTSEWPDCQGQDILFTAEPSVVHASCEAGQVAEFPCIYNGTESQPYLIINSTIYPSVNSHLPRDHSYYRNVLRVTNVFTKNNTFYQCILLSVKGITLCAYKSTVGELILDCQATTADFSVQSLPLYHHESQMLKEINTVVTQVDPLENAYNITYVNSNDGTMCGSTPSCMERVCNHTFEIKSSTCPDNTDITVLTSMADSEFTANPKKIDAHNRFVKVDINVVKQQGLLIINCIFMNQPEEGEKVCRIRVGPDPNNPKVDLERRVYDTSFVRVVADNFFFNPFDEIWFMVTASNSSMMVEVEGKHPVQDIIDFESSAYVNKGIFSILKLFYDVLSRML